MEEDLNVNQEYKKAFNEGYLLASELGMKSDALKDINAGGNRIKAIAQGMKQYEIDHSKEIKKDNLRQDLNRFEASMTKEVGKDNRDQGRETPSEPSR